MVTTVTTNSETGEQQVIEQASMGGVASSDDYNPYGITARGERGYVVAQSPDQLSDNDLVKFDGMELTVAQAKEYGVLDAIFGKANASDPEPSAELSESAPSDPTVSNLQDALEAGEITPEEEQLFGTANAELELAGMDAETALQSIEAIAQGENPDISGDTRSMLERVSADISRVSTMAARSELGPDAFAQLQAWAKASPEVNESIRGFAAKRATGDRSLGTWTSFYQEVADHMTGR